MKKIFTTIGLFAILGLAILVGANAYMGNFQTVGPNYSEERHDMMEEAFETSSYQDWFNLMSADGRTPGVLRFVNENNFDTFTKMHEAMENGDYELAEELRAELGMGQGMGQNRGNNNRGQGRNSQGGCPFMN